MRTPERGRGHECARGPPAESRALPDPGTRTALVLLLLLLSESCVCAPQNPASDRSDAADGSPHLTMVNPFGAGEEERRLLQRYVKENLKDGQLNPDLTTWEQEIFFLFSLHDYDRSSNLDGLEMMKLLSDFLSHRSMDPQSGESVVSVVDGLLQTQDQNQDGLLDLSELLSPPMQPSDAEKRLPQEVVNDSVSPDAPAQPAQTSISEQHQGDRTLGEEAHREQLQQRLQVVELNEAEREVTERQEEKEDAEALRQPGERVRGLSEGEQEVREHEQQEQEVRETQHGEEDARGHVSVHEGQPEM